MSEEVECDRHGSTLPTFACRHAVRGVACGFWIADPEPDQSRPDGMCDLCDERSTKGEEIGATDIRVICGHCWDEARARNQTVPELARGKKARLTPKEQHALIHHAVHELQATQERGQAKWGIGLGSNATSFMRWQFSEETRSMTFSSDGVPRVIADVRMVGTYAAKSGTFQWAWHTYKDREHPLVAGMSDLEGFGEVRGIERLTKMWWECDQQEGWEMTALAAYLFGCDAAYRAPFEHVFGFMLLTNMRAAPSSKPRSKRQRPLEKRPEATKTARTRSPRRAR